MRRSQLFGCTASCALHVAVLGAWALQPSVGKPPVSHGGEPRALETYFLPADPREQQIAMTSTAIFDSSRVVDRIEIKLSGAPIHAVEPMPVFAEQSTAGSDAAVTADTAVPSSSYFDYQARLLDHIRQYSYYPAAGLDSRLEGTVQIGFALQRNGTVLEVWIESSSGHAVLDAAALDAIRRAQPLPPVPSSLPASVQVLLPVGFSPPRQWDHG